MMEYFGGPDAMKTIFDQMANNPRMEINNIKTVKFPLTACFERIDAREMKWDGQELTNGDVVYWMDQHCTIYEVRIFVDKVDPAENFKLTVEENLKYAQAAMNAKREVGVEVCSGPDCGRVLDDKGYNMGAF